MTDVSKITGDAVSPSASPQEFLSFMLGGEEYGINVQCVQALRGYEKVTQLTDAPDYIKGIINLRCGIVPVIDMRLKLGIVDATYNASTVVIILNVGWRVMGMVVDGVSEVMAFTKEQIKATPPIRGSLDAAYLLGLATVDERKLILIDIAKLMRSDEIALMGRIAA